MAKPKKKAKKSKKIDSVDGNDKVVSKSVKSSENSQLVWILIVIGLVFAGFIFTYIYFQGSDSRVFEYGGLDWVVEDHSGLTIYHGRVQVPYDEEKYYNVYFRNDPRRSNIDVDNADFKFFKMWSNVVIAFDKEAGECTGQLARAKADLVAFLQGYLDTKKVYQGVTYIENSDRTLYVDCSLSLYNNTVIEIRKGDTPGIVKNNEFPSCYTIYIDDCDNFEPVEKFMVEVVAQVNKENI